jgi:hypothetical protein
MVLTAYEVFITLVARSATRRAVEAGDAARLLGGRRTTPRRPHCPLVWTRLERRCRRDRAPARPGAGARKVEVTHDKQEATAAGYLRHHHQRRVMAAAHTPSAIATDVAVLVTLDHLLGGGTLRPDRGRAHHQGHRPSWQTVRDQVTSGWEMVTASFIPLAVLTVVRLAGASLRAATIVALICSTVLLCIAGWRVGQDGRLTRLEQVISTLSAGAFGAAIIVLKALLH